MQHRQVLTVKFQRISAHFSAFQRISAHFSAFQRISAHFSAFQRISLVLLVTLFCLFFMPTGAFSQSRDLREVEISKVSGKWELSRGSFTHNQLILKSNINTSFVSPSLGIQFASLIGPYSPLVINNPPIGDVQIIILDPDILSSTILTLHIKQSATPYQSPDAIWTITTDQTFTPQCENAAYPNNPPAQGYASAYIKYGSGHNGQLVRPIIFVDGIDFDTKDSYTDASLGNAIVRHGATGWDVLTMGMEEGRLGELENGQLDYETFGAYPTAFQSLLSQNAQNNGDSYDIIFLDFSQGADYIQRNSLLLQELIRRVNQTKVANAQGLTYQNVVLGASMGGQVARHALASMERKGEPHCTHTYVSFDSPQRGANIALGVQALGWYFYATSDFSDPSQKGQREFWEKLSTPAAQQLLINHFGNLYNNQTLAIDKIYNTLDFDRRIQDNYACLRAEFMAEMSGLDYPKKTRNIAISCGSSLGNAVKNQGYAAGDELLDVNVTLPGFGSVAQVQLHAQGHAGNLNFNSGGYYVRKQCGLTPILLPMVNSTTNVLLAVATPAGKILPMCDYHGVVVRQYFPNSINLDHVPGSRRNDIAGLRQFIKSFAEKSLSISNLQENTYRSGFSFMPTMSTLDINWPMTQANLETSFNPLDIVNQGLTPFAAVLAPTGNLKHVEISPSMITWLQGQMLIGEAASGVLKTLPSAGVSQLLFNKSGIIQSSYTVNSGGSIVLVGDPSVKVGINGCAKNIEVIINSGADFSLGSSTTVAEVRVSSGATVKLLGSLKLNSNNAAFIVESGGKLIIEPNANIDLAGTNSRIVVKNGGELIINGQFDLTGLGHFYFETGNIFTLNNSLEIIGVGTQVPRIILSSAQLLINQNVQLKLTNTKVLGYGSASYLNFKGNATFEAQNVKFSSCSIIVEDADDANPAPNDQEFSLKDCIFENSSPTAFEVFDERGSQAPQAADFGNIDYKFENCQFINCPSSILVQRAQTFQMLSCSTANIEMLNTYFLDLENTRVMGGVKTSKVGHFRLMNSVIDGGNEYSELGDFTSYGIHTTSGYLWALVMLNSTVQNCDRAIKFDGGVWQSNGARIGLLHMDCSALINNKTGIKGTDIIFSIYSRYNNIGETANIFTQSSQAQYPDDYLIDAVFNDRPDLDTDLWFHGNYWNGGTPPSNNFNTFWRLRTKIVSPPKFDPWFGTIHTAPVRTNLDPSVVQCGGVGQRNDQQNPLSIGTIVNVNGILRDVKVQQDAGWRELNGQNLKSAVALLRPVAHLAAHIADTANAKVKHLVEVARALALETPNSSGRADKGTAADGWVEASFMGYANPRTVMDIVVSPNPAQNAFKLELPEGEFTVDVFNALGNRVYQKTVYTDGVINIDVTTWQNAFYLVQVVNTQTKEKAIRKIVVQH
jgi:hypothetical protein